MNNKEVAKLIPVIQAFLEGKTIERKTRNWEFNKGWCDATQWEETEELKLRDTFVYRIKPEKVKHVDKKYISGDLVSVYVGIKKCIVEVIGTENENEVLSYQIKFPNGEIQYADKDNIVPIPLTPEILEKNGWKLSHGFYWSPNEEGAGVSLASQTGYVWEAYIGRHLLRSNINNVSDLQHLLFGLGLNHEMEV